MTQSHQSQHRRFAMPARVTKATTRARLPETRSTHGPVSLTKAQTRLLATSSHHRPSATGPVTMRLQARVSRCSRTASQACLTVQMTLLLHLRSTAMSVSPMRVMMLSQLCHSSCSDSLVRATKVMTRLPTRATARGLILWSLVRCQHRSRRRDVRMARLFRSSATRRGSECIEPKEPSCDPAVDPHHAR